MDVTTEGDQAEEYVDAAEGPGLISISASANALTVIRKRPQSLSFVRYVTGGAPSSRWEVKMEVECAEPMDEVEEEDGGGEDEDDGNGEEEDDSEGEGGRKENDIDEERAAEKGGYEDEDESVEGESSGND